MFWTVFGQLLGIIFKAHSGWGTKEVSIVLFQNQISDVSEILKCNDQNDTSKTTSTFDFPSVYFGDVCRHQWSQHIAKNRLQKSSSKLEGHISMHDSMGHNSSQDALKATSVINIISLEYV